MACSAIRISVIAVCLTLVGSFALAAGWQERVSPRDADKMRRLDSAWSAALADARVEHRGELAALGALVRPKAALADPIPAPGLYRCRTVKLGDPGGLGLSFVAYDWFRCRIERSPRGELTLAKITGSQRSFGVLYPDGARRLVFVGAESWGSDETAIAYGAKPDRNRVGALERIGPQRWRLALPWPEYESKLDLIELTR